jgi:hypothetical protein
MLVSALVMAGSAWAQTHAPAAAPPASITYDQAVANEQRLFAVDQQHDMDAIASMVADEFVDIARDGSMENKSGLLKEIPTLKLLKYAQRNYQVVTLGPFAYAISYDSDATAIDATGKEVRTENALNTVWIKRDGRWQILLHSRGAAHPLPVSGPRQ